MKGTKGSSISLSFVFINEIGRPNDKPKKIIFPSNLSSLMKSVNNLYKEKYVVRSIYTSNGDLVQSLSDISPGMTLYVSPNEPSSPPEEEQNRQKTVSLYSNYNESSNLDSQKDKQSQASNQMNKERKQTYNHLFGLTSQNSSQGRFSKTNDIKPSNKPIKNSKTSLQKKSYYDDDEINETKNDGDSNVQNKNSREKLNKLSNTLNRKKSQKNNQSQSSKLDGQPYITELPSNLYSNLDNFDNDDIYNEYEYDINSQINKSEENLFNENAPEENRKENNVYNNTGNYYERDTSEVRDADSSFKKDNDSYYKKDNDNDNEVDDTVLCQVARDLLNEDTFAQNVKASLDSLDDKMLVKFLTTSQTLEDNQRNYWFLRYSKYFEKQGISKHGNYMFGYDSIIQYIKDFISRHRFIMYPISNINMNGNKKTRKNKANSTAASSAINGDENSTANDNNNNENNNNETDCSPIYYSLKMKSAIGGPRKSGKSTMLSMIIEQVLTELAISGAWKNTVPYYLNMDEISPLFDNFKSLYLYFIEFSLKSIILQKPELSSHLQMLVKFFESIFEFSKAPKLKKIFSSKPQFQKFSLNCEKIASFFSKMWNNNESHFLFFTNIFQIPILLASAAEISNIYLFVDNIEYSHSVVLDDLESGQEFDVYEAFSLLLEKVNYVLSCEDQTKMFESLDDKTEIISTLQLNAQTQYQDSQFLIKYDLEPTDEPKTKKKKKVVNEIPVQKQQMILTSSYCGEIPAFISLWEEINAINDEIDQASENNENNGEDENENNDENEPMQNESIQNEIDELEDVLISLIQNFVNDLVIDNEEGNKIKVTSARRLNQQDDC